MHQGNRTQFVFAIALLVGGGRPDVSRAQASADANAVLYTGPVEQRPPLRICRIFAGGARGPWINYVPLDPSEGTPSCIGRGFDTMEPVIVSYDPCAGIAPCAPSCVGLPANGFAKGGIDPFCTFGPETPTCPIQGFRWLWGS